MEKSEKVKSIGSFITIISIISGFVISIMNYRIVQEKESESRKIEAAKPFLELRQTIYLEALKNASILASKDVHTEDEVIQARKRFSELFWSEAGLIEESSIERDMIAIAESENLRDSITPTQMASYALAHSMRESLIKSCGVDTAKVGRVNW